MPLFRDRKNRKSFVDESYERAHPRLRLEESVRFEGNLDAVWERVSSVDDIPKYWHGTKSLQVLGNGKGDGIRVRTKFAFGGSGEAVVTKDVEQKLVSIDYTSGPFVGKQTIAVKEGEIAATWDVTFKGFFRLGSRWNEAHFRAGTKHALRRLSQPPF